MGEEALELGEPPTACPVCLRVSFSRMLLQLAPQRGVRWGIPRDLGMAALLCREIALR
jgi:hypothetical protein